MKSFINETLVFEKNATNLLTDSASGSKEKKSNGAK